jgi:hypothetical protein
MSNFRVQPDLTDATNTSCARVHCNLSARCLNSASVSEYLHLADAGAVWVQQPAKRSADLDHNKSLGHDTQQWRMKHLYSRWLGRLATISSWCAAVTHL